MDNFSTVMLVVVILGVVTAAVCVCGLISDGKKQRAALRESRRKNLSDNTVKTVLSYNARQRNEAMYYRRRA